MNGNGNGNGAMQPVNLGSLTDPGADTGITNALGHAIQTLAEKASSASDGAEAKDYASGAKSLADALMEIVAPKVQKAPEASGDGAGSARKEKSGS